MHSSRKMLFLPLSPLRPMGILALCHPELFVVDHPLATSARPWRYGNMTHFMKENSGDGHLGDILSVVGSRDGDQVPNSVLCPKFLMGRQPSNPRGPDRK